MENILWAATAISISPSGYIRRGSESRMAIETVFDKVRPVYRNGYSDPCVFNNQEEVDSFVAMLSEGK